MDKKIKEIELRLKNIEETTTKQVKTVKLVTEVLDSLQKQIVTLNEISKIHEQMVGKIIER